MSTNEIRGVTPYPGLDKCRFHVPGANAGVLNFLLAYPPAVLPMPRRLLVPATLEVAPCCSFELPDGSLWGGDWAFEDE